MCPRVLAKRATGFTLVEVLVALTVIALALGAALSAVSASIRSHHHTRLTTLTSWVAMDVRTQWSLGDTFAGRELPLSYETVSWGEPFSVELTEQTTDPDNPDSVAITVWPTLVPQFAPVTVTASAMDAPQ